jgi:hypothetical protein
MSTDSKIQITIIYKYYIYIYIYILRGFTFADAFRPPYSIAFCCSICPFESLSFIALYISSFQVLRGRPRFFLPSGSQWIIIFGRRVGSILSTWPYLYGVWWSKNITRNRKKMIYNSMVKSVLIYGAEIWSLYEDDRRRINATEMNALRRSARTSKLDRKTNEYIHNL